MSVRNSTSQALDRFVSPDAPWRGSFRRIPTDIDDKTRKVQYAYDEAEAAATGGYDSQGRIADPSMFERIAQEEH